jgi:hypothetical protein
MRVFARRNALLRFRPDTYTTLLAGLAARGQGSRESGAFLLTPRRGGGRTVTAVAYFDDLDAHCLVGGIHLDGDAFPRLWDLCDRDGVRVIGDIHTHPGPWVSQSSIDADNPLIARRGHVALIAPDFAQGHVPPAALGVHVYRGDTWQTTLGADADRAIYVGRWA